MADRSAIEWTDSTFNPWTGCTKVSPGCDHCYAESWSARAGAKVGKWGPGAPRVRTTPANWRLPVKWNAAGFFACSNCGSRNEGKDGTDRDGAYTWKCRDCGSERLQRVRRRVFCASLADVFDNEVPTAWRGDLLQLINATPNLDWLLLTKRIGNVMNMVAAVAKGALEGTELHRMTHLWLAGSPPPNVWLGATIVDQEEADRDIPKLLATPARVRFLSMEPLLGPVDLSTRPWEGTVRTALLAPSDRLYGMNDDVDVVRHADGSHTDRRQLLQWVIVGGESGHQARPMHPSWARSLRDQCAAAGVPFLFKQWGNWCPRGPESMGYPSVDGVPRLRMTDAGHNGSILGADGDNDVWMNRAGKKAAGRLLDGRTHDGFPGTAAEGAKP